MLIESSEQLRSLTGNYYANNDFAKIQGDIEQATEELAALVGEGVIDKAEQAEDTDPLRLKVQRPIAILATLRLYQKNDLSHEDDGRKFKVSTDGTDKLPWEWQLDRDDALQMEAYFRAVDALINHLNKTKPEEWTNTPLYRSMQQLIVRSGADFDRYFPIQRSERTYLLLVPFIREAQLMTVQDAYGADWPKLLAECMQLGGCETGSAKITKGYELPCKYVIHAVGPRWRDGCHGEQEQLASCYRTSLTLAKEYDCRTVAFPLISSGIYGYPKAQALQTAIDTIRDFLKENDMTVYLVLFDREACKIAEKIFVEEL